MSATLTGAWGMTRFSLRRDRVLVPVWLFLLVVVVYASAAATGSLYPTLADRVAAGELINASPAAVAAASGVTLRLELEDAPLLDHAYRLASQGVFSGGRNRGKAALAETVSISEDADPVRVDIVFDAETSGGLLICVPEERAALLERALADREVPAFRIGTVVERGAALVSLVP